MTPQEYCQQKAAASGSSFYYSFRFLPDQKRHAIIALYAFCREIDDVVDETSDAAIARIKLCWWRDEIKKLFHTADDNKPENNPTHPVALALKTHLPNFDFKEKLFYEIIDGMEMDLDYDSYPSFKELSLYCYRVASVVGLLTVEIFGYQDKDTLKYATDLGMAFQLTNILRDVHEDAVRGRIYIPLDELKKFDVKPEELQKNETNEKVQKLFAFQKKRADEYYEKAFAQLPKSDRYAQRSGVIMAEIYLATLNEIELDGFRVLEHRVRLTPIRKLWIAWKTARREKKQYNR